MTATLPPEVQRVFDRFVSAAFTIVDGRGQPITSTLAPDYRPADPCIDLETDNTEHARANPKVALLFSDPAESGLEAPPQVLVQGIADVDERVHVRPERVYVWHDGDVTVAPELFDAHMEEVRSGHDEEPPDEHATAAGGAVAWDERIEELGARYREAVVALVAPDGFPFSVRVPIELDRGARRVRLQGAPVGVPWQPGLACVSAQRDLQVRGDLVQEDGAWAVVPHELVG